MRLYPKKLRNIEDLERERKLLLKESKRMDEEEFLSLEGILGSKKKGSDGNDGIGSLLDYLPVSNPMVSMLIKLVQKRRSKKADPPSRSYTAKSEESKKGKSILKTAAIEVIGGYLKWKAIELSYKGISHLIKKRKEKRASDN